MNKLLIALLSLIMSFSFLPVVEATPYGQMSKAQLKARMSLHRNEIMSRSTTLAIMSDVLSVSGEVKDYYKNLLKICGENKWRSCSGSIPHCWFKNGKKRCSSETITLENFEYFQLPILRASKKVKTGVVSKRPIKITFEWYDKNEIRLAPLLNKFRHIRDKAKTIWKHDPTMYESYFMVYLGIQKTEEARIAVLKEFAKVLMKK